MSRSRDLADLRRSPPVSDRGLLVAFFLSGFAALGYEILWTRLLAFALGSEAMAVLGVLAGFFGGMALGAFILNGHASRCARPARVFVLLETGVALYAIASPRLLLWLSYRLPPLIGSPGADNASLPGLAAAHFQAAAVLLPATFCLGASWAYGVAARRRIRPGLPEVEHVSRLYFANTLGAATGVFSSVYLILPRAGLEWGAVCLAALGASGAALAFFWQRRDSTAIAQTPIARQNPPTASPKRLYLLLTVAGVAGVGVEFAFVHLLGQLFNNTVYTFANLLAIYLLGTAAGAWLSRRHGLSLDISRLFGGLALAVLFSTLTLWCAPSIYEFLRPTGAGLVRNLLAEIILSSIVFLPSTVLMGALFSRLAGQLPPSAIGRGYGWNTLGAALAPCIVGLTAFQLGGTAAALGCVMFLYLSGWLCSRSAGHVKSIFVAIFVLCLQILAGSRIHLITLPEGWTTLSEHDTLYGNVIVSEQRGERGMWGQPLRRLQVNGTFRMGGGQGFAEMRMGHLALLLQPRAKNLLYLGSSTGVSLGAARGYPFERIDAVEIVPQIIAEMHWFRELNFDVQHDPRVRMIQADARRFVAGSTDHYDLIVADLFHPGLDGAGNLYTVEHYQNVSSHLNEDGIAVQAVPLYQFETPVLQSLVRTFLEVFPEVHAFLGIYNAETPILLLVGKRQGHPLLIDPDWIRGHLAKGHLAARVIQDVHDFLAAYVCDREGLAAFAAAGKMNTDLSPFILFQAPRQNYLNRPQARYESLESLSAHASPPDFSLLRLSPGTSAAGEYLASRQTWRAAHKLMEAKIALARGPTAEVMPRVVALLEDAYQADPDFAPARGELLQVADESPQFQSGILSRLNARDKARVINVAPH